jgi:hypothetical protein
MSAAARITQVVIVLADGMGFDLLQRLVERGRLPALSRLSALSGDGAIRGATSVFPSTTGPAHLPFLTGRFPGPCNIPGIRWFHPARYAAGLFAKGRFRSYMGLGNLMAAHDLERGVQTVFELVRDHASIGGNLRRGVRRSRNLTRWSRVAVALASYLTESRTRSDAIAAARMTEAVGRRVALVFAVFYGIDAAAHKWGGGREVEEACERIDNAVGGLLDGIEASGRAAETLVLFVSDHGHSPTSVHLDLHGLVERLAGRTLAHPTLWRGLLNAQAAVMVSGNAMAHVYLRGDSWTAPKWLDAPGPELKRLLEALLAEPAVDQVIGAGAHGGAVVLSARGRARIRRDAGAIVYAPDPGGDPFGYPAAFAGTRDERAWLADTWRTDYPDAPAQVLQILQSARAGHLIVTARPGYDLRARFEKPSHRGSHGSLHRLHLMTPLLANHPLAAGPARTVDILPTVLDALGIRSPAEIDGRSLWPAAPRGEF